MNFIELEETPSTNSWIAEHCRELDDLTFVTTRRQSAGRGQRGNTWESEPGKNLTFSLIYRPVSFKARDQFAISEATAQAIVETLAQFDIDARIKWPNDIYVADKKICGILIEHSILGMEIAHTIIGAGLNVNQLEFRSDAPNPVSMAQLAGREYDLQEVRDALADHLERHLSRLDTEAQRELVHQEFLHNLWRADGRMYRFRDRERDQEFLARICDIEQTGHLILEDDTAACRRYAFKEVEFLL